MRTGFATRPHTSDAAARNLETNSGAAAHGYYSNFNNAYALPSGSATKRVASPIFTRIRT
jgi:hypothetical protein